MRWLTNRVIYLFLIGPVMLSGQQQSLFGYLYDKDDVVITMSESVKTIKSNFEKNLITEGKIDIATEGQSMSFNTSFDLGGKTRRKICRQAPVKINFKKKELENSNFESKCDKNKIVFQCNGSKSMLESIKMEKTIYDLYEVISGYGRRAKMISINQGDSDKQLMGFLLEDDDDFEFRTGTEVLKNKTIATHVLNRDKYVKMCLFQYMISNADWSARRGHNTDLYRRMSDNALLIVPYDFDYAGIIDNSYAVAPENLPITEVTQRYFMDKKVSLEELSKGIEYYLDKEKEIYITINQSSDLSEKSKKRMTKFIEGFYKIITNDKKVKRMIK